MKAAKKNSALEVTKKEHPKRRMFALAPRAKVVRHRVGREQLRSEPTDLAMQACILPSVTPKTNLEQAHP